MLFSIAKKPGKSGKVAGKAGKSAKLTAKAKGALDAGKKAHRAIKEHAPLIKRVGSVLGGFLLGGAGAGAAGFVRGRYGTARLGPAPVDGLIGVGMAVGGAVVGGPGMHLARIGLGATDYAVGRGFEDLGEEMAAAADERESENERAELAGSAPGTVPFEDRSAPEALEAPATAPVGAELARVEREPAPVR